MKLHPRSMVCIAWGTDAQFRTNHTINWLVYGDKKIRTYIPGKLDSRCGVVTPVKSVEEIRDHLRNKPNDKMLLTVELAIITFGFQPDEFADLPDNHDAHFETWWASYIEKEGLSGLNALSLMKVAAEQAYAAGQGNEISHER